MKKLILILVLMNLLSFGCATTKNFNNFKCSDCYNQDSVKTAIISFLNQKDSYDTTDNNYEIDQFAGDEEFWFIYCRPHNPLVRGGGYDLTISKKQCKIVKVYSDP